MQPINSEKFDHDKHARSKDERDFWGQIKRTVNGQPVSDDQISLIVDQIADKLLFRQDDIVLDLACGNGALSSRFFGEVQEYKGVDFSGRLIEIAEKYFSVPGKSSFVHSDAFEYLRAEPTPEIFTKVLCYGSFPYFSANNAEGILLELSDRFHNVERVFIGNLPDKRRAEHFYSERKIFSAELDDHESSIGIWRSKDEFTLLAHRAGWDVEFSLMPKEYYAAHYRYDALLTRKRGA